MIEETEDFSLHGPIGIFDSGYGGLTILNSIRSLLPMYDYIYLGDNARSPYGTRSFDVVYKFTRQAVLHLFKMGCYLIILACNTASAKALRTIQQKDLPKIYPSCRRVLGIIRPTAEIIGDLTKSKHIGILATEGTIRSNSYAIEIAKFFPEVTVNSEACPMWVPLVECNEGKSEGADYFIKKHLDNLLARDPHIDVILLGCTHYPLLLQKIKQYVPSSINIVSQGNYVAQSLKEYLCRHNDLEKRCTKGSSIRYLTTEDPDRFCESAQIFINQPLMADKCNLTELS